MPRCCDRAPLRAQNPNLGSNGLGPNAALSGTSMKRVDAVARTTGEAALDARVRAARPGPCINRCRVGRGDRPGRSPPEITNAIGRHGSLPTTSWLPRANRYRNQASAPARPCGSREGLEDRAAPGDARNDEDRIDQRAVQVAAGWKRWAWRLAHTCSSGVHVALLSGAPGVVGVSVKPNQESRCYEDAK